MRKTAAVIIFLFSGIFIPGLMTMVFTGRMDGMQKRMGIQVSLKNGNQIDGEEFVMGMAATQISRLEEEEALKAWMIVCRTNFLKAAGTVKTLQEENLSLDYISPEEMEKNNGKKVCQEYQSRLTESSEETFDQTLYYGDEMIDALYHQVSPGKTISSAEIYGIDVPYLVSMDSSQDVESADYLNNRIISWKECAAVLKENGTKVSEKACRKKLKVAEQTENGYVKTVAIGKYRWTGEEWKNMFGLSSPYFYLESDEDRLRMVSLGKGHGMGLSLYGADALAGKGRTAEEILAWYYPGTEVKEFQ